MPEFNQKGPMCVGVMTGRHMGLCNNFGATLIGAPTKSAKELVNDLLTSSARQVNGIS